MTRQSIKDRYGQLIGTITDEANVKRVYDRYGQYLGEYRKSSNTTVDRYGMIVSQGEACSTLLHF